MSEQWNIGPEQLVEVYVNGEFEESVDASTTLRDAASSAAREHGLRTVTVKVNGNVVSFSQGNQTLAALGATRVDVLTKDQRA